MNNTELANKLSIAKFEMDKAIEDFKKQLTPRPK
jgi:hypothetical protein